MPNKVETCERCYLVHPATSQAGDLLPCALAQAEAMRKLLTLIAGTPVACGGCGAKMYFVHHKNGKRVPYTEAGLNHFVDCPARDQFARKK